MREPLIIGHRGASAVALENTMAAFEAAIAAGADGVEFDVRLSRNDVPVIIHDDTLYRTLGLRQRVVDLTAEKLREVDVPSLRELFQLMTRNNLLLCLEIKASSPKLPALCCELIDEFSFRHRVIIECFDLKVLKAINPRFKTATLFEPRIYTDQGLIDRTLEVGASVLALHYRIVNPGIVENAKLAGLKVVVWTVDNPAWVERARSMGIEALITNDPARMIEATDRIRVQLNQ
jgi:glycerophosphoryl diester phosphodiesterase